MINKDLKKSLLKLSFILFFLFLFISFSFSQEASFQKDAVYLLEKEYNILKNNFEKYLLPFPKINFFFSNSLEYQEILNNYSSLPSLEVIDSYFTENTFKDLNLLEYDFTTDSNLLKKSITYLKINDHNFSKEYIFLEIEIYNKDLKVIDVFDSKYILSSDKNINRLTIDKEYLLYTEDQSFLLSKDAKGYAFKPFLISKKELIIEDIFEEKDNTLLYFLLLVVILFLIYFTIYYKKGLLFKKILKNVKKEIRKTILKIDKKRKNL